MGVDILPTQGQTLPGNSGELLPGFMLQLKERLDELAPLVEESKLLESALAALEGEIKKPNPPGRPRGSRNRA